MVRINDENAPPEGPNEADRARFGFKKAASLPAVTSHATQAGDHDPEAKPASEARPKSEEVQSDLPDLNTSGDLLFESDSTLDVVSAVHQFLSEPDADLPLLQCKLHSSKYDYKGRMTELQEQNRGLRAALSRYHEGYRTLRQILPPLQEKIDIRVQAAARFEKLMATQFANGMQKLQEALQDDMHQSLRQCCEAEARRANAAEALLLERNAMVADMEAELELARQQAYALQQFAKKRVDESRELLDSSAKSSKEKLLKALARIHELEDAQQACCRKGGPCSLYVKKKEEEDKTDKMPSNLCEEPQMDGSPAQNTTVRAG